MSGSFTGVGLVGGAGGGRDRLRNGFADEQREAGKGEAAGDIIDHVDLAEIQAGLQGLQRQVHLEDDRFAIGRGALALGGPYCVTMTVGFPQADWRVVSGMRCGTGIRAGSGRTAPTLCVEPPWYTKRRGRKLRFLPPRTSTPLSVILPGGPRYRSPGCLFSAAQRIRGTCPTT